MKENITNRGSGPSLPEPEKFEANLLEQALAQEICHLDTADLSKMVSIWFAQ